MLPIDKIKDFGASRHPERRWRMNISIEKCCNVGEYKCQTPMPLNGRRQDIDYCIADLVAALNAANIPTTCSCCGHEKMDGTILLEDGRELWIKNICPEKR